MNNKNQISMENFHLLKGAVVENPEYFELKISEYQGNPLIEALPPIRSPKDAALFMANLPAISEQERELEPYERVHCVEKIFGFVHPLDDHIDLEQRISRLIRYGYVHRNPCNSGYVEAIRRANQLYKTGEDIELNSIGSSTSTAGCFIVYGLSGVGKTTAVDRVLLSYPQLIFHHKYKDSNFTGVQVVWLKLECPFDGSPKQLCLYFFQALDSILGTNYYRKYYANTTDQLIASVRIVAATHHLGFLVIDEIQVLSSAKKDDAEKMLNFFTQMRRFPFATGVPQAQCRHS